jgi:hypothetical protein
MMAATNTGKPVEKPEPNRELSPDELKLVIGGEVKEARDRYDIGPEVLPQNPQCSWLGCFWGRW